MKTSYTLSALICLLAFSQSVMGQWERQYPLEKLEDVADLDVSQDGYGFAVGNNDLMLRLDPVTKRWSLLPGFGLNWRFESVDYLDGSEGSIVAAGGNGLILSMDKGETWTQITGPPDGIHTLKMFSADHIVAVTDADAYIWRNNMWTDLEVPAATALKGGFILDSMRFWVFTFASDPAIYYTTDGGQTWNTNLDISDIDVVRFYDALYGIATDGRDVYQSFDGGASWALSGDNALTNTINDLAFGATANVLIGAAINAEPAISTDSGKTWTAADPGLINQRSFSVVALSNEEFWMGLDISSIWLSENGGATWIETSGPDRNIVQDVYFINRSVGFAVGQKGMFLTTRDGGNNWEDQSFSNRNHLAIHGTSETDLWIGANQRILHSADTGNTWTEALIVVGGNINDIYAISSDRILAVSSSGIVYRSNNGGAKWDTVYNAGAFQLKSIASIDGQRYMVTGFNGIILRSADQGETWTPLAVPEAGLQYEQAYFSDPQHGWLITSSFQKTMWSTADGGDNWTPIELPVDRFWDGVYFITQDTGVIVGRTSNEGRAYLTFNGGETWSSAYVTSFPLFGAAGVPNPNGTAWIFGFGSDIEVLPYCDEFPVISNFVGLLDPCEGDTVTYFVNSENIDIYTWSFPPGWTIVSNANNDTVSVAVGSSSGVISVGGSNPCGETGMLNFNAGPLLLPSIFEFNVNTEPCPGDVLTLSSITLGATQYLWTVPTSWIPLNSLTDPTLMVQTSTDPGVVILEASNQCGTTERSITINVQVLPFIQIIVSGNELSLSGAAATYQWYLNSDPIAGATNATYTATQNGVYHVEMTHANGCVSVTPQQIVMTVATVQVNTETLTTYPNPASTFLYLKGIEGWVTYTITDATGRILLQGEADAASTIDIASLPHGMYLVKLKARETYYSAGFVKQ